jgi:hypothetical protein
MSGAPADLGQLFIRESIGALSRHAGIENQQVWL